MENEQQLENKMRFLAKNMKTLTQKLKLEQELLENARHSQTLEPGIAHIPHCPLSNLADIDPNCKVHGALFTILKGVKKDHPVGKFTLQRGNHEREFKTEAQQSAEPNLLSTSTIRTNVGLDSNPTSTTNLQSIFNSSENSCTDRNNRLDIKAGVKMEVVRIPTLSKSWMTLLNEREYNAGYDSESEEPPISTNTKMLMDEKLLSQNQGKRHATYYLPANQQQNKIPVDTISKYLECYNEIENQNHSEVNRTLLDDTFSIADIDNEITNLSMMVQTLTSRDD